jgi:hypothetical protein
MEEQQTLDERLEELQVLLEEVIYAPDPKVRAKNARALAVALIELACVFEDEARVAQTN